MPANTAPSTEDDEYRQDKQEQQPVFEPSHHALSAHGLYWVSGRHEMDVLDELT